MSEKERLEAALKRSLSPLQVSDSMQQVLLSRITQAPCPSGRVTAKALIVLICMLLLCSAAYAFSRPDILDWLLGYSPASSELESTAQAINCASSADEITARITGLVFDGKRLAFSYELENSNPSSPALVAIDSTMLVAGRQVSVRQCTADPDFAQMVPSPHLDVLPVQRNPAVGGGWSKSIAEPIQGQTVCEITFIIYRPKNGYVLPLAADSPLANPAQYDAQTQSEIEDSLKTLYSFENMRIAAQLDNNLSKSCTVVNESGVPAYPVTDARSHLLETARIQVAFNFDASNAFAADFSGADDYLLEDCRVHIDCFRLSSLETAIDLSLIPSENSLAAAQVLADRYGSFSLTNELGDRIVFSEMDYLSDFSPDVMQLDGQWVCRYVCDMPGLLTFPGSIGFTASTGELMRFDLPSAEE